MQMLKLGVLYALAFPLAASSMDCVKPPPFEPISPPPGYYSGFINGSGSARAPAHLPANAAGVLFHTDAPIDASDFTILETATGARLPLRLTVMRALTGLPATPMVKRFELLDEQLYRVEPHQGFKAGHSYRILSRHAGGSETHLRIDHTAIDPRNLGIGLRAAGMANRENLTFDNDCLSLRKAVVTQNFEFDVPARLRPYRHSIAAFPINKGNIAWNAMPQPANAAPGASRLGREWRHAGLRGRLYYSDQAHYHGTSGSSKVAAMAGFLEIEDRLYETPAIAMSLDPRALAAADSLDFLRHALRGKDGGQLQEMLEQIPVRRTDYSHFKEPLYRPDLEKAGRPALFAGLRFGQRQMTLQATLARLLDHPDAPIRIAAGAAMVRVLKQGRHDVRSVDKAARALAKAARADKVAVRQSAADSLLALVLFANRENDDRENDDYFCERTQWRKWFAPCLDPALFKPAFSAFVAKLGNKEYTSGLEALHDLQRLSEFPGLLIPALVDAPDSEGRRRWLESAMEVESVQAWLAAAASGKAPQARRVAHEALRTVRERQVAPDPLTAGDDPLHLRK